MRAAKVIPVVPTLALLAGGIVASCSGAANPNDESPDEPIIDPNETSAGAGGSGDPASGGASGLGGALGRRRWNVARTRRIEQGRRGWSGPGHGRRIRERRTRRRDGRCGIGWRCRFGSSRHDVDLHERHDGAKRARDLVLGDDDLPACDIAYAALPKYYGAMNQDDYRDGAACGTCARVVAEGKTLDVAIGDLCPYQGNERWCFPGSHHIDLSPDAFAFFADPNRGALEIQWKYVPCAVTGGIAYTFKAESTQYWAEVLISNYPYEITKLEFMNKQGTYQSVPRMPYNYFQASSGMGGPGPYKLRVTDIHGSTVEDTVPLMPGGTYRAPDNFGLCKM